MTKNQKENILLKIKDLEEKIETCKVNVKSFTDDSDYWNGAETATSFACRLNGYILELRGMFAIITAMGYEIKYDKKSKKVIDIVEDTEE